MKLSIIIPVYNEEKTLSEVIRRVKLLKINKEILVVDDGSTDRSQEIIRRTSGIKKFMHKKNCGKGAAVKTALKHSKGDIFLVQDADLELDPFQIPRIIAPIRKKEAKVVYGSRNKYARDNKRDLLFYFGGHLITFFTNLLFGTHLTYEPCGYKAFDSKLIKSISIDHDRFEWEPEVTAKIAKMGIRIEEVRVKANSRSIKEGKKLRRRDGVKALLTLIKYKFVS